MLVTLLLVATIACSELSPDFTPVDTPQPTTSSSDTTPTVFGYTHHRPDGNRLASGRGALPTAPPIDIPLDGVPVWLVAADSGSGSVWIAILDDGRAQGFVDQSGWKPIAVVPDRLPVAMSPLLRLEGGEVRIITAGKTASSLTHPVPISDQGHLAYIDKSGDLVLDGDLEETTLPLSALPDARILADGSGRLLLLSDATGHYAHGAQGDTLEAKTVALVDPTGPTVEYDTIAIPATGVVEGISLIWADLDGDGTREIIATVSDVAGGAHVVVYNETGKLVAEGPDVGSGFRWRHQIAVAPFGPDGDLELAVMLTPHIGGVVEFYRMRDGRLDIVARLPGPTSHVNGSRNLDMALAGDLDGDGRTELLVLSRGLTKLIGVRRTVSGAEEAWSVETGGRVSTNIAAVETANGGMAIGVGRADEMLRIWQATVKEE